MSAARLPTYQPAVAAGIRLISRAGYITDDLALARQLDGFFSLLQIKDSQLIERAVGVTFLSTGKMSPAEMIAFSKSRDLRTEYSPRMRALLPASFIRDFDANTADIEGRIEKYRRAIFSGDSSVANNENLQAWNQAIAQRERTMTALIEKASSNIKADANAKLESLKQGLLEGLGILLLVGILVFASCFFVVRKLASQIGSLADRMKDLSEGNTDTDIPYLHRTDEIGTMATAMEAFKANIIENHRLTSENEAAKATEAQRQKAILNDLADRFETEVGGIVDMVSTAATAMQATATQLSASASQASTQSTSVASAAEEAGTNVNSVASSAEELGASVQEISRQVEQSVGLARSAVKMADTTGPIISELSQGASRIGDIVEMISTIASQTNLLALNATIEAARAERQAAASRLSRRRSRASPNRPPRPPARSAPRSPRSRRPPARPFRPLPTSPRASAQSIRPHPLLPQRSSNSRLQHARSSFR